MTLHPENIGPIPEETIRVARAAFPKGNNYMRMRDELGTLYTDDDFADLFPRCGQLALAPWRLALITIMQFAEGLSDRQAADAVRARIDWKYALGLELTDPGFDFSVLSEFRARLQAGEAEERILERMLDHFRAGNLLKARGRQRTDSTAIVAAIRVLNRLELVGETMRQLVNVLANVAPDWVKQVMLPAWSERYIRPGTIAQIVVALDFATTLGTHSFAHRNGHRVNDKHVAGRHHLVQQADDEQQNVLQAMQAPIEPRYTQFGQVTCLLQHTQRSFMMILKVLGCHNRYCQNLSATDVGTAIIGMPHHLQNIIDDHITRYNIGGVHGVPSANVGVVTSILPSTA